MKRDQSNRRPQLQPLSDEPATARLRQLEALVRTYAELADKWKSDDHRKMWGESHADAMSRECSSIADELHAELQQLHKKPSGTD